MNRRYEFSLLALALLLAGCRPPSQAYPTPEATSNAVPPPSLLDVAWEDRSPFRDDLAESQQAVLDGLAGLSVYHLALRIEDDLTHVTGQEEVLYTNREGVPLQEIDFRLFPNALGGQMKLDSAQVNGEPAETAYGQRDSLLRVMLARPLAPDERAVIALGFSTLVPPDLASNYGVLSSAEGVLAYAHGYPMIAVYDDRGWNSEVPPPYGDVVYSDASLYLVRVDAPARLVLVASGKEVGRQEAEGRQVVTFAAGPARDFFLAASPDYRLWTQTAGPVTLRLFVNAQGAARAENVLTIAAKALADFGDRFGKYPYRELDIVATPNQALGIEYPGVFALTQRLFSSEEDFGTPESMLLEPTVAHETGHQWFYNLVGNDQIASPWLDESLTQFITLQYFADEYGKQGAEGLRQSFYARWDRVNDQPIPIGEPVQAYSDLEYGAIVYGRGALFFEAMQQRMGSQAFDAFLRDYAGTLAWDNATPTALKQMAEKKCACDLTPLFREWVSPD